MSFVDKAPVPTKLRLHFKTRTKKGAALGTCLYLAHPVQFSLVQESKATVTNNEKDVTFGSSSTSSRTLPSTYPTVWEHQGPMLSIFRDIIS